ncbi:AAA family ATPase [Krasilnikovia sp. MM14-A1259]|uniref:AAA family ATPase n=1 Tax=Krasilnikovia sp. MM14-A1259 TaxID=3373539 RepID=UPI003813A555
MLRRVVLTGAPGSGKTTLLQALRQRGHAVVEEAATDVIAVQQDGGIAEPWRLPGFVDLIVALQRERQVAPVRAAVDVQVFDRSPLCTLALARYLRQPVSSSLAAEVDRVLTERVYEREVFLVRPLGFVAPTAARRISYEDSLEFELVHESVYREHGFTLVDVPPGPTVERVAAVEDLLGCLVINEGAGT